MNRRPLGAIVAAGLLAFTAAAFAHAFLERATPAVGSTVHAPPAAVTLRFTQRIEPAFSSVRVQDGNGRQVDRGDAHADAEATALTVSVPPLPKGTYKVVWRVLSADTHVTEGDFTFDVAP